MIFRFGDNELDTQLFELRSAGMPLQIEPKVFDLLTYLIRCRDRVVTKQEIVSHLWPQQFVSDAVLAYCVMAAGKAVGDDGRGQRVIKTLHGRGYRFVADVDEGFEDTAARAGAVTAVVRKEVESGASTPEGPVTLEGGVAAGGNGGRAAEAPWEPKLVTVLAIDVS